MPSDHGRRFDEYQGIDELRPQSVEPDPEQTVGEEEPKTAGALPPEYNNLMSQRNELEFQRCAAANTEREQGNEGGQNRDHAPDGMAAVLEIPQSLSTVHRSLGLMLLNEIVFTDAAADIVVSLLSAGADPAWLNHSNTTSGYRR